MNEQIDITKVSDLQLASFVIRANNELQRAVQNVNLMQNEVARREQEFNKEAEKPVEEDAKKIVEKPVDKKE